MGKRYQTGWLAQMTLQLKTLEPFAQGGNRLCFIHPLNAGRVIKVRRPEFTLEDLRKKKGFPRNLRPLSWLDDNKEEFRVMQQIKRHHGESAFEVVSHCYGFEDTDMGPGLTSELIRNADGKISYSMMEFIWRNGYTSALAQAVVNFRSRWESLLIPSRDLILHNILVQCDHNDRVRRLVVIDGLGSSGAIPFYWLPKAARRYKTRQKLANFQQRINEFIEVCASGTLPNTFWQLKHDGSDEQRKNTGVS